MCQMRDVRIFAPMTHQQDRHVGGVTHHTAVVEAHPDHGEKSVPSTPHEFQGEAPPTGSINLSIHVVTRGRCSDRI